MQVIQIESEILLQGRLVDSTLRATSFGKEENLKAKKNKKLEKISINNR